MNILKFRTATLSTLVASASLFASPGAWAQSVTVNGSACAGATVTLGAGTIAINTAGCGGGTQVTLPAINSTAPPAAKVGNAYSFTFTASGTTPISWTSSGTLPPGLSLSSGGTLAGTPTTAGTYSFSVIAGNSAGNSPGYSTSVAVAAAGGAPVAPVITSFSPPTGALNVAYNYTFGANGSAPITWSKASGTLPAGLSLSSAGILSGTPTQSGTYPIVITATNSAGSVNSSSISIVITGGVSSQTFGAVDINNVAIPSPVSKVAKLVTPIHPGPNGGGNASPSYAVNGWSVDTSKCTSTPHISTLWYHNIDILDYGFQSGSDFIDFAPNEALTYAFNAGVPALNNSQVGRISLTQGAVGSPAYSFVSISTSPCDFDTAKVAAGDKCYSTGFNENGFTFQITTNATSPVCKLTPNTRYYLNVRFQDARPAPAGTPTVDACASQLASHPGSATCGAFLQIQAY